MTGRRVRTRRQKKLRSEGSRFSESVDGLGLSLSSHDRPRAGERCMLRAAWGLDWKTSVTGLIVLLLREHAAGLLEY